MCRGIESRWFPLGDKDILLGSHVKTDRPVNHRGIMDVDILIDGNADLRVGSGKACRAIQCSPRISLCGVTHLDHAVSLTAATDLVVQSNIQDRRITAVVS